jgi:hypothetical protein
MAGLIFIGDRVPGIQQGSSFFLNKAHPDEIHDGSTFP